MAAPLTEDHYTRRRTLLCDQAYAAAADHARAAYRHELGEGSADAVAAARAAAEAVDTRIAALDAAWEQAEREQAVATAQAEHDRRAAAARGVARQIEARAEAADAIEAAIAPLKEAMAGFTAANEAILSAARMHKQCFPPEGLTHLRETVLPQPDTMQELIGGLLWDAGWRGDGIDLHQAWFALQGRGLAETVRARNAMIRAAASPIAPGNAAAVMEG
jgi:hypothetical protein